MLHHALGIIGGSMSQYMGGMFGSLSHLTCSNELSTPFVNLRVFLSMHGYENSPIYVYNGAMMAISFLVLRIVYQYYCITKLYIYYAVYRGPEFWSMYSNEKLIVARIFVVMSIALFILNFYWFTKIIAGLLRAMGLEKVIEDAFGDENEEQANDKGNSQHKIKPSKKKL